MTPDYHTCRECGISLAVSSLAFRGFEFCSWSCIRVFVRLYNTRLWAARSYDGNFPSLRRRGGT